MTPEERAAKIVKDENWYDWDYMRVGPDGDEMPIETIDRDLLQSEIAAAIRAAVEAQREADAQIAEETARAPMDYIGWSPGPAADDRARIIAAAIRHHTHASTTAE